MSYFCSMNFLDEKLDEIKKICSENKVKFLFAFGSVVRDELDDESDIDFLVDLDSSDPYEYTDLYYALKGQLQKLLGRRVDLLEYRALRNQFIKEEIDKTKVAIYG